MPYQQEVCCLTRALPQKRVVSPCTNQLVFNSNSTLGSFNNSNNKQHQQHTIRYSNCNSNQTLFLHLIFCRWHHWTCARAAIDNSEISVIYTIRSWPLLCKRMS